MFDVINLGFLEDGPIPDASARERVFELVTERFAFCLVILAVNALFELCTIGVFDPFFGSCNMVGEN